MAAELARRVTRAVRRERNKYVDLDSTHMYQFAEHLHKANGHCKENQLHCSLSNGPMCCSG